MLRIFINKHSFKKNAWYKDKMYEDAGYKNSQIDKFRPIIALKIHN